MATLSESDRIAIWEKWMRRMSQNRQNIPLLKLEVRAAVDSIDDWVDANAASFNDALPAAAKANLTAAQKAELLSFVVLRRFEVS